MSKEHVRLIDANALKKRVVKVILRFQILLVVITKLFLRLKLIRAFALSLRRDDLSWRIFLIMKNALKSCEKLNQKRTNQQNCD